MAGATVAFVFVVQFFGSGKKTCGLRCVVDALQYCCSRFEMTKHVGFWFLSMFLCDSCIMMRRPIKFDHWRCEACANPKLKKDFSMWNMKFGVFHSRSRKKVCDLCTVIDEENYKDISH